MQTLPKNMTDNPNVNGREVEFVVVNYGNRPEMHEWMMTDPQMQEEIAAGRLVYAAIEAPDGFRHSHAKNVAHRMASGDVVCNVDGDNFTGRGFATALARRFEQDMDLVVSPSTRTLKATGDYDDGVYGRIALSRDNFHALGGYRESYKGWGREDADLLRRSRMAGLDYQQFTDTDFMQVIPHGDELRLDGCGLSDVEKELAQQRIERSYKPQGLRALPVMKNVIAIAERLPSMAQLSLAVNNKARNFGEGDVTLYTPAPNRVRLGALEGQSSALFNSLSGIAAMVEDRLKPTLVSLEAQDAEPS